MGTTVTGVEFNVRDPWKSGEVSDRIEANLGFPYRVDDWQKQNSSLFSALKLEKFAMGVILLLIVLVASFNIVSTLIMVVTDKIREIGILRAMGLTARDITRIFVLQGVVIGLIGTALGISKSAAQARDSLPGGPGAGLRGNRARPSPSRCARVRVRARRGCASAALDDPAVG